MGNVVRDIRGNEMADVEAEQDLESRINLAEELIQKLDTIANDAQNVAELAGDTISELQDIIGSAQDELNKQENEGDVDGEYVETLVDGFDGYSETRRLYPYDEMDMDDGS